MFTLKKLKDLVFLLYITTKEMPEVSVCSHCGMPNEVVDKPVDEFKLLLIQGGKATGDGDD